MNTYQVTLSGAAVRKALWPVVYAYARLSIDRIVTVRGAPTFTAEDEARWRDYRDTLQTIGVDLPDVGEPDWHPVYDMSRDYRETNSGKIVSVAGMRMRTGVERELKKGATPKPTYSRHTAEKHAHDWAEAVLASLGHPKAI